MITASAQPSRGSAARLVSRTSSSSARSSASRTSRACGDGSIATTRAPAPGRPVDQHAGEVAGVGADLDDGRAPAASRQGSRTSARFWSECAQRPGSFAWGSICGCSRCIGGRVYPRLTSATLVRMTTAAASPGLGAARALAGGRAAAGQPRFPLFDSLRGLAVLSVLVWHVFVFTGALDRRWIGDAVAVGGRQGPLLFFASPASCSTARG